MNEFSIVFIVFLAFSLIVRLWLAQRHLAHISLNRGTKRNKPKANRDQELREAIHRLTYRYPRFGYRKIYDKLKEADWKVGRERVRLIRKQEGLQVISRSWKKPFLAEDGRTSFIPVIAILAPFFAHQYKKDKKGENLSQFPEDDPDVMTSATQQCIDFISNTSFQPVPT